MTAPNADYVKRYGFLLADLPDRLRNRCCSLDEPWVNPDEHDHGHTDCLLMRVAADEIERLRERR